MLGRRNDTTDADVDDDDDDADDANDPNDTNDAIEREWETIISVENWTKVSLERFSDFKRTGSEMFNKTLVPFLEKKKLFLEMRGGKLPNSVTFNEFCDSWKRVQILLSTRLESSEG